MDNSPTPPSSSPPAWMPGNETTSRRVLTAPRYVIGVLIIFAASYAQYLVSGINFIVGAFVVYGISIIAIILLYRAPVVRKAFRNTGQAVKIGLSYFGVFTVLGSAVTLIIVMLLLDLKPDALAILDRPLPVLHVPPRLAWIMVWVSIFIIGPCEEYIFRGFVFGGLLTLFGAGRWLPMAFISSVLFAIVHLYYALIYGVASLIPFVSIVAIGMALAITYYRTGGNLLIPALIHGVYDATGFIAVAVPTGIGGRLRGMFILMCVTYAILTLMERKRKGFGPS